ncbi:hypothetical protein [Paenibacillus sp. 32O-W]|uniref:hypothetical protein n=1 Tax=Paenibacillus sp. 32O-W TaxID=1695218 RepID=UPI0011A29C78|nr:hypothetical protein [Paenibacillus sp. 32O-W]
MIKKSMAIVASCIMIFGSGSALAVEKTTTSQVQEKYAYYTIEGFTSLDENAPEDFKETDQYVEHYTINFFYNNNTASEVSDKVERVLLTPDTSIKIKPIEYIENTLLTDEIEIPLFKEPKEFYAISNTNEQGGDSYLTSISTNVFFTPLNNEENENDFYNKEKIRTMDASQSFTYLTSSIYVTDEYNSDRSQKRHRFSAYHSRPNIINDTPGFANTTSYDSKPDVLALAWNVGGAIPLNDPSINMTVAYNNRVDGDNYYAESSTHLNSTKHNTMFTGTSIGFEIPDTKYRALWPLCWASQWHIEAKSGWYNVGSYNGANGTVRTELLHTYTSRNITVTPSIGGPPLGISLSISGETQSKVDIAWVYSVVSPN